MTNPNIVGITALYGNTAVAIATTATAALVTNANGSNKIYKINSLYISNYQGTNATDITVDYVKAGVAYPIVSTVSVAADSTLIVITKDTAIYLMENATINVTANITSTLNVVCSWDEIT